MPNRSVKPMSEAKFTIEPIKKTDQVNQSIKVDKKKATIKATFKSFNIKDGKYFVAYIPSLDMTGYGDSENEAVDMLKDVMDDFFSDLIKLSLSDIDKELAKYGWNHSKIFKKQFSNRAHVDKGGVLKGFEMPKDTPIEENILQVA